MFLFILILFFLSGFTGLIYQMVWLKKLHLIFGVTTPSIVAILIAFMSGLSLGSFIIGKYSKKFKNVFLIYGLIEGMVGLYAINIDFFFQLLDSFFIFANNQFSFTPLIFDILRFLLSFIILFIPTFLMGGTLPLLVNGLERQDNNFGEKTGILYGINTLGAFFGTFLSTFYFIPNFGFKLTNSIAVFINIFIFLSSLFIPKYHYVREKSSNIERDKIKKYFLLIIFFMGFSSFGYEILWNRILILHTGSNVYAYGLILCNILLGIGAGSLIYSLISNKIKNPVRALGFIELFLSICAILQLFIIVNFSQLLTFFANFKWQNASSQVFGSLFLASFILLFFPTFLMGLSFPVSVKIMANENENPGKIAGKVYGMNTFGCISGTFISGIILISLFGTTKSFFIIIFINALLAFFLFKNKIEKFLTITILLFLFFLFFSFPHSKLFFSAGTYKNETDKIIAFKEDLTGAIVLIEKRDGLSLEINGVNVAGTSPELFLIQKLQGHIPLLFSKNPENVLHIGLGSGGTLYTVSNYPVKKIYVAEISKGIIKVASNYFKKVNDNVFRDERVKIKIADGRNFVLASKNKFDIILSDSIHPKYQGNGFLYTKDYFNLLSLKINDEGIVSMWLPLYSMTLKNYKEILKAFSDVFPYTFVWWFPEPMNSFTIVIGSKKPFDFDNFIEKIENEKIKEDLKKIGLDEKEKIISSLIMNEKTIGFFLGNSRAHIDDLPTVEYESNKVFTKTKTWLIILKELHQIAPTLNFDFYSSKIDKEKLKYFKRKILNEMERQIEILSKTEPF